MARPTRKQPLELPLRWYWSLATLAEDWGCSADDLLYHVDAGTLRACALVPKAKLPAAAQRRIAPFVCVVLGPAALDWQHADGDGCAWLVGEFTAFVVEREAFATLAIELTEPALIARRDLVVLDADREEFEAARNGHQRRRSNKAQDRADALIVRVLVTQALGERALENPYATARRIREAIELEGGEVSTEAIARKIKTAAGILACHGLISNTPNPLNETPNTKVSPLFA